MICTLSIIFIHTSTQGLVCVCEQDTAITTPPPAQSCDLPGVTGPACDSCLTGYYNYSESSGCQPCNCDLDGTLDSVCDTETGLCNCASGVMDPTCGSCPPGSIGPSRFTVNRCTSCFCNGYSMRCESAEGWYQAAVSNSFKQGGIEGFKSNGVIRNISK